MIPTVALLRNGNMTIFFLFLYINKWARYFSHMHCLFLTLYLMETSFNTFANRTDPDQTALCASTLCAYGNMIRSDPTLVDLTSNFFVLCTNVKVYFYNYS